jgi:hypothetical protein
MRTDIAWIFVGLSMNSTPKILVIRLALVSLVSTLTKFHFPMEQVQKFQRNLLHYKPEKALDTGHFWLFYFSNLMLPNMQNVKTDPPIMAITFLFPQIFIYHSTTSYSRTRFLYLLRFQIIHLPSMVRILANLT